MFTMFRIHIFALAALTAVATASPGQQVRGKFNPEGAYHTNIQLAAGRLTAEVQGIVSEIGRTPAAVQRDLGPRAERTLKSLDDFSRTLALAPNRERLRREYGPIDTNVKDLIYAARGYINVNQNFVASTAAISAANIQLEYAIIGMGPTPPQGN